MCVCVRARARARVCVSRRYRSGSYWVFGALVVLAAAKRISKEVRRWGTPAPKEKEN